MSFAPAQMTYPETSPDVNYQKSSSFLNHSVNCFTTKKLQKPIRAIRFSFKYSLCSNSNINRLVFGHLNINSLSTEFDFLCEQIKGSIDVFMISESKLDDSFPRGQFLIDGFHTSFRFDRNKNGRGMLLYVR